MRLTIVVYRNLNYDYLFARVLESETRTIEQQVNDTLCDPELILVALPAKVEFDEPSQEEIVERTLKVLDGQEQRLRAEFHVSLNKLDQRRQELLAITDQSEENKCAVD